MNGLNANYSCWLNLFRCWGVFAYVITLHLKAVDKNKFDAARFSPVWNEIIRNLREEDYITNLLVMEASSYFSHLYCSFTFSFLFVLHVYDRVFLVCSEMELLLMPKNSADLPLVQWPLFLLASKVIQIFKSWLFFFFLTVFKSWLLHCELECYFWVLNWTYGNCFILWSTQFYIINHFLIVLKLLNLLKLLKNTIYLIWLQCHIILLNACCKDLL